eukprot:594853-Pleurochrysis_carterae.AAC.10
MPCALFLSAISSEICCTEIRVSPKYVFHRRGQAQNLSRFGGAATIRCRSAIEPRPKRKSDQTRALRCSAVFVALMNSSENQRMIACRAICFVLLRYNVIEG